jgi:uncharacterized membrane protein
LSQRLLAAFFSVAGMLHFVRPRMYEAIVPDFLPAQHEIVLVSGAAELAGAALVVLPRTRRIGGVWLAVTLVAVFPANVSMALQSDRYEALAPALLWARLPLQGLLIWWALRATRPGASAGRPRPSTIDDET